MHMCCRKNQFFLSANHLMAHLLEKNFICFLKMFSDPVWTLTYHSISGFQVVRGYYIILSIDSKSFVYLMDVLD